MAQAIKVNKVKGGVSCSIFLFSIKSSFNNVSKSTNMSVDYNFGLAVQPIQRVRWWKDKL